MRFRLPGTLFVKLDNYINILLEKTGQKMENLIGSINSEHGYLFHKLARENVN